MARELNFEGLEEFLQFRFLAGESTLFRNIFSLLPGHILRLEGGDMQISRFWDFPSPGETFSLDENSMVDQLDKLLQDSVKLRLMSDVPLGSFCSGCVDSGLTTAYAVRQGRHGINAFSVGFQEAEFDESRYALMVSDQYRTSHHSLEIDNRTFADSLPRIIWYYDEPLNHANSVPIYHISKLAKQFVTVVLTSEGSDELFGGYPRYLIAKICAQVCMIPHSGRVC